MHDRVESSLAGTTGVHTATDVAKLVMAGADVAQMCAVLLQNGPNYLSTLLSDLETWMEKNEYESISTMKGSMSQKSVAEPAAFERANYMKALNDYSKHFTL
jgi:dihydroorotate dehydrogenase (fumarate)